MKISIITPSYQSSEWLKLCIASVADQGVDAEHIVQDSESTDGTCEWLGRDLRVTAVIEKDMGMYDGVNRGLRRASGDVLAYLNCDEQYLPGTLARVAALFSAHPDLEVVFGNALVVDSEGQLRCYRKCVLPRRMHSRVGNSLSIFTCATFFRRSVCDRRGLFFDSALRALGDVDWVLRCLDAGVRMNLIDDFLASYTETGSNMSLSPQAHSERLAIRAAAPLWARQAVPLLDAHYRLRKLLAGAYTQAPFSYSIYTRSGGAERLKFQVDRPVGTWTPYSNA
jgi:glycosyltransferase involved in cell wall biosynthesis